MASCPISLARWAPLKAEVAVDRGSALVRQVVLTNAELHERLVLVADTLIQGDERAVFADHTKRTFD